MYELEQDFNKCSLDQESKNPDEWFAELQKIRLQLLMDFTITYTDEKVITHMLYNIKPKGYETIVALLKRDIHKKVAMTLDGVQEDLRQVYGTLSKHKDSEQALVNQGGGIRNRYKGDCRICGKKGHKGENCWENERNKDKRPSFYKPNSSVNPSTSAASVPASPDTGIRPTCTYCQKLGHIEAKCFKKKRIEGRKSAPAGTESA